jgi:hypothetical protein
VVLTKLKSDFPPTNHSKESIVEFISIAIVAHRGSTETANMHTDLQTEYYRIVINKSFQVLDVPDYYWTLKKKDINFE